jgi:hypothetical protein
VRMTKPNSASSHDWHVQLCCQRSELLPPERAALDQGLAGIAGCVLELDGAVCIVLGRTGDSCDQDDPRLLACLMIHTGVARLDQDFRESLSSL